MRMLPLYLFVPLCFFVYGVVLKVASLDAAQSLSIVLKKHIDEISATILLSFCLLRMLLLCIRYLENASEKLKIGSLWSPLAEVLLLSNLVPVFQGSSVAVWLLLYGLSV